MLRNLILRDRSESLVFEDQEKELILQDNSTSINLALILPAEKDFLLVGEDSFLNIDSDNGKLIV